MWVVTIRKNYTEIKFNFEALEDAADFMSKAAYSSSDKCEVTLEHKKGEE